MVLLFPLIDRIASRMVGLVGSLKSGNWPRKVRDHAPFRMLIELEA